MKTFQLFEALEKKMFLIDYKLVIQESHVGEEQPQCVGRNAPLTVRYFLIECYDLSQIRNLYYQQKRESNSDVFLVGEGGGGGRIQNTTKSRPSSAH